MIGCDVGCEMENGRGAAADLRGGAGAAGYAVIDAI
jgi:hypothetical protein